MSEAIVATRRIKRLLGEFLWTTCKRQSHAGEGKVFASRSGRELVRTKALFNMLANALGTVPTPGPHARNPRARRGCCLCPAACFASGTPDLVGLFCSREGLLLRPGYRQTRGAVLKMTALAASQVCSPFSFGLAVGWVLL